MEGPPHVNKYRVIFNYSRLHKRHFMQTYSYPMKCGASNRKCRVFGTIKFSFLR